MTLATRLIVDRRLDVEALLAELGDRAPRSILRIECACGYPAPIDVTRSPTGELRGAMSFLTTHAQGSPHRAWLEGR